MITSSPKPRILNSTHILSKEISVEFQSRLIHWRLYKYLTIYSQASISLSFPRVSTIQSLWTAMLRAMLAKLDNMAKKIIPPWLTGTSQRLLSPYSISSRKKRKEYTPPAQMTTNTFWSTNDNTAAGKVKLDIHWNFQGKQSKTHPYLTKRKKDTYIYLILLII